MAILKQLNLDYKHSDQASDAKRFSEFLAEDFIVQTPGVTRDREEYLEYIAKPRPFKDLVLRNYYLVASVAEPPPAQRADRFSICASAMSIDVAIGVTSRAVWANRYPPWRAPMRPIASWSIDASGGSAPPS